MPPGPRGFDAAGFIPPVCLAGCACTTSKCGLPFLHSVIFFLFHAEMGTVFPHLLSSIFLVLFVLQNSACQSCSRGSLNSQTKQVRFKPILAWKGGFCIKSSQFGYAGHQQLSVHSSFSKIIVGRNVLSS